MGDLINLSYVFDWEYCFHDSNICIVACLKRKLNIANINERPDKTFHFTQELTWYNDYWGSKLSQTTLIFVLWSKLSPVETFFCPGTNHFFWIEHMLKTRVLVIDLWAVYTCLWCVHKSVMSLGLMYKQKAHCCHVFI